MAKPKLKLVSADDVGITRNDMLFIMDTFDALRAREVAEHGHFRTMDAILDKYDELDRHTNSGIPYRSPLGEVGTLTNAHKVSKRQAAIAAFKLANPGREVPHDLQIIDCDPDCRCWVGRAR